MASIIRFQFQLDPYDKDTLFLFCGKKNTRIKGLLWEGDGFLLLYKRLDVGAFSWPRNTAEVLEITSEQYKLLMEPKPRGKKKAGKKEADMSGLPVNRVNHYMTEEELIAEFGENGWKQLPDAISKRYKFIPAKVIVTEHHVGVYASKKDNRIVKADHPKALLKGSPVSASIAAAIMNGKYVNAFPLYRLEKEFERYGLTITRQNMANWMIRLGETYISVMYVAYTK